MNPYNCSKPGWLFVGYKEIRKRIVRSLQHGNSFALLGGRRCGKTSLLLQLEKDLTEPHPDRLQMVGRVLDMQGIAPHSPADFFRAIYDAAIEETAAPRADISNYQTFLTAMTRALPAIEQKYGPDWITVLLIDELESAIDKLPDSECLENFRNLLMMAKLKRHFRAVVTGVFSPAEMTAKGSPLNNLDPEYLAILRPQEVHELVLVGFPNGLSPAVQARLLELTGRHAYIVQGVLGYLFDLGEPTDENLLLASRRFVRDRAGTFQKWLETFRSEGCRLYQGLLDGVIRDAPNNNALAILSYHGVIDESSLGKPKIGCVIFREWFEANGRLEQSVTAKGEMEVAKIAAQPRGKNVFVVHGRDFKIRNALFTFLRTLGLQPLNWTALVEATNNPSPHINEILKTGFRMATCAVVLLTPDDEARLLEEFHLPDDPDYEKNLSPQPRPNVLFEAGMAMAHFPDKTVLVQMGWSRPFSDVAGIHAVKMDNSIEKRRDLARRLHMAGCDIVDLDANIEWQTKDGGGDFSPRKKTAGV